MEDDRQFVLRPGYKFPNPMTYKEVCERVNFEVQKVGSDPVRPKIRKRVDIRGELVPSVVSFYCCHRRVHVKRDKPAKTPSAARVVRKDELRTYLYSECTCCFNVVLDPIELLGSPNETRDEEADDNCRWQSSRAREGPIYHSLQVAQGKLPFGARSRLS